MEDQKTCSVEKYGKGFCDEPAEWKLKYKHYPEALFCAKHKRMVNKLLIGKRRWSKIEEEIKTTKLRTRLRMLIKYTMVTCIYYIIIIGYGGFG